MSGGVLTGYTYDLGRLDEWAEAVAPHNALLAEQLTDLHEVLHEYDYWLSGDVGEESAVDAWNAYVAKWLEASPEELEGTIRRCMAASLTEFAKGFILGNEDKEE